MAEAKQEINDRPDSCEVSISTKGVWSGKVKCYKETLNEAMKEALTKAKELDLLIKEKNSQ